MKSYYATVQRNYLVRKLLCSEKLGENSFNRFIATATTIYYYCVLPLVCSDACGQKLQKLLRCHKKSAHQVRKKVFKMKALKHKIHC